MFSSGKILTSRIEEFCKNMINAVHFHTENSPSGTKFCLEFSFLSRILSETDIIIYTSPCLEIKILLRILLFQQNFVRILISQQNFVSNRHHCLHLPLSRNQNSASNFAFPAEFCQNSDITAEFRLKQTSLSTPPLVSKSKFCLEFCFPSRILSEF